MTGPELKAIRKRLALSAAAFGYALGYSGPRPNVGSQVRKLEREAQSISPQVERLALMYDRYGVPDDLAA